MATKEQHDFFLYLYEEEERRYGQLESRAKLYISIVALFLASLIFKVEEVQQSVAHLGAPWWLVVVEGILLATALVFIVFGVFIRTYEGLTDPEDVVNNFGDEPPSNEEFFDDRIADYAVATTRNAAMNDRAARFLEIAVSFLAMAMLVLLIVLGMALFK